MDKNRIVYYIYIKNAKKLTKYFNVLFSVIKYQLNFKRIKTYYHDIGKFKSLN
jgi:hypothetical protein